jgi:hypothetical protein
MIRLHEEGLIMQWPNLTAGYKVFYAEGEVMREHDLTGRWWLVWRTAPAPHMELPCGEEKND